MSADIHDQAIVRPTRKGTGRLKLWRDVYPLIRIIDDLDMDRRDTCIYVRRLQHRPRAGGPSYAGDGSTRRG